MTRSSGQLSAAAGSTTAGRISPHAIGVSTQSDRRKRVRRGAPMARASARATGTQGARPGVRVPARRRDRKTPAAWRRRSRPKPAAHTAASSQEGPILGFRPGEVPSASVLSGDHEAEASEPRTPGKGVTTDSRGLGATASERPASRTAASSAPLWRESAVGWRPAARITSGPMSGTCQEGTIRAIAGMASAAISARAQTAWRNDAGDR